MKTKFQHPNASRSPLDPVAAIQMLKEKGFSFEQISRRLGKPQNYAVRVFHRKIVSPSYETVDALRALVKEETRNDN